MKYHRHEPMPANPFNIHLKQSKIRMKKSEDFFKRNFAIKKSYFSDSNVILSNKTVFYKISLVKQLKKYIFLSHKQ